MGGAYFSCGFAWGLRRATGALALGLLFGLPSCSGNCATYVVAIVAEDDATGELLCDARVTFGVGDAGQVLDASSAPSDAEVPTSSASCQWDIIVEGGVYQVNVVAKGFRPGSATVTLPRDECGSATAPVSVMLVRSGD